MINKKKEKESNLLAVLQRKSPASVEVPVPLNLESKQKEGTVTSKSVKKTRVGKPVQFWLHDEDRRLLREIAAWLAGQGLRPTDSLVIRATLRMAKTNGDLLLAYQEAAQLDGRLKQNKQDA